MDISHTLAPTSDQLDAVDLLAGPQTFTIERASKGDAEQPVNIHLAEFPRPWRPGKSMRRVLVACWGADTTAYTGRRVTLFCDTSVRFGGQEVGGVRVSHLSHLDKPRKVPLLVSRGKSAVYVVQPLAETVPPATSDAEVKRMFAAFWEAGITEKAAALAYVADVIGRTIDATRELTPDEADAVTLALKADMAGSAS